MVPDYINCSKASIFYKYGSPTFTNCKWMLHEKTAICVNVYYVCVCRLKNTEEIMFSDPVHKYEIHRKKIK